MRPELDGRGLDGSGVGRIEPGPDPASPWGDLVQPLSRPVPTVVVVQVVFTKGGNGRTCGWVALRPPRSRVPGPVMAAGGDIPHDLATFVLEAALGLEHGFWGCVAEGATFKTLGRRRTEEGKAVIRRHAAALDDAERQVNAHYFAWRAGTPTPVDAALDDALVAWRQLPDGGELVRTWPLSPTRRWRGA